MPYSRPGRFAPTILTDVAKRLHHRVYVVRLDNPRGDGREGYYVGMTGLSLDERFSNHKRGYKSSHVVRSHGVELAWEFFDGIPAMTFEEAALTEVTLADDLRDLGYLIYGPTNRPARRPRRRRAKKRSGTASKTRRTSTTRTKS